ncbi:histidine kinase dimerization/phospho-acceptor domain-containing protein [Tepidibacter hydrothermalis]|uniref:histidine kinase n=1 Tax=Tepidibacter hydrothermalis TaxID=3036126 RepID=A0ABY8EGX2_9FIRM|nr:histidine kinase dimerization/phospho-acceptor domain-containing protein [Tepidibacter hydrothermalis]WFD12189.1 histidine kinase dimerization/phospho-acceptor domain-containing protein [Tepidibacter hydrothermalis]
MDTNLKNNKFKQSTLSTIIVILILSIISVGIYTPIKEKSIGSKNYVQEYIKSNDFVYTLEGLNNALTLTRIGEQKGWYHERYENIENIKYHISYNNGTLNITNIEEESLQDQTKNSQLTNNNKILTISNIDDESIEDQIKNSQLYINIVTDENGNIITKYSSNKEFKLSSFISKSNLGNGNDINYSNLDIKYFIPKKLIDNNDLLIRNMNEYSMTPHIKLLITILLIGIVLLIIGTSIVPYSKQSQIGICRLFNKCYLEIKLLMWFIFFGINMSILSIGFNYEYSELDIMSDIIYSKPEFYIIGIPLTFMLYLLVHLSIVYVKHIYNEGIKEGLINKSIFGKIILKLNDKIKDTAKCIGKIDTSKPYHVKAIILFGINFILLFMIAALQGIGVIIALIYTVFMFKYTMKFVDSIKKLNEQSSKLANGNFNVNIDDDIGILSSIAKNLNNIKTGFKVAVDKETKSQNMKTELITNVSHDLKTPLTSIINYVDLLKDENITDEEKDKYIDILDSKSKRLKILIEDLFEASKVSSGNVELNIETLDIISLFRQTLGEMDEKISESGLNFKVNMPDYEVFCELDGRRTYRIFENIIGNILKYSMQNSRVYIDIIDSDDNVELVFKNISSYEMNFDVSEITQRFTRGDKSRNIQGSGLGLNIAKSLVDIQNGCMDIVVDGDLFKLIIKFQKKI